MTTPTEHLDQLASALAGAGLPSSPRYCQRPQILRVYHPDSGEHLDNIHVQPCPHGQLWFFDSRFDAVSPVEDLEQAVKAIETLHNLGPDPIREPMAPAPEEDGPSAPGAADQPAWQGVGEQARGAHPSQHRLRCLYAPRRPGSRRRSAGG